MHGTYRGLLFNYDGLLCLKLVLVLIIMIITAHIRRMGEDNVFTGVCPFTRGGGGTQSHVLSQVSGPWWEVPQL